MTKEVISRLMQSTNPDDVEIALQFLFSYKIKDIKEIMPWGTWSEKQKVYSVNIKPRIGLKNIKYHHSLYCTCYWNTITFRSQPLFWIKYTSLYE